jgi:hypothetical protein
MYKLENEKLANNEKDRFKPPFKQSKHVYFSSFTTLLVILKKKEEKKERSSCHSP